MSGKRGSTTLGSEEIKPPPPNARWITFEQSDGDFSIRPEPRNPERDSSGKWNFFRQVPLDERQSTEWRRKIGNKLAEMLNYKDPQTYYVKEWPKGYEFYDHNKQQADGNMRHDAYLYGSPHTAKFRSTNEFIPHGFWLKTSATLDNSECSCKYCAKKKSQRDVNESVLGEPSRSIARPRVTKPPRAKNSKEEGTPPTRAYPQRHDARFKNIKIRLPYSEADLPDTAAYTARKRFAELHEGRIIRDGELIWIPLIKPIRHPKHTNMGIDFWPAFAHDIEYRKEVIRDQDGATYTVKEQVYIVTRPLISGTTVVRVLESSIVPFRAWDLDEHFAQLVKEVPLPSDFSSGSKSIVFAPTGCRGEQLGDVTFEKAAPYYALAVQTAVHMDKYWTPMYQIEPGPGRSGAFYQGLWLGAERIWLDDLVRIHQDHNDLMTHNELIGRICPPEDGSESRSILMRITEIVVDDVATADGPRKTLRISGPAYYCTPDPTYNIGRDHTGYLSTTKTNEIRGTTNSVHFPMPVPPIGFQYKPLSPFDEELVLDGFMIAGRYYPRLFWNPTYNLDYIRQHRESWWLVIVSMSGLAPGKWGRCNAHVLIRKRREAAELSEAEARQKLIDAWRSRPDLRSRSLGSIQDMEMV